MDTNSDLTIQKSELNAWLYSNSKTICAQSYTSIKNALSNLEKDQRAYAKELK